MATGGAPRDQGDRSTNARDSEKGPVEQRSFLERVVQSSLPSQSLRYGVRGRQRHNRSGKEGGAEQPKSKEGRGELSGKRLERHGCIAGVFDLALTACLQRRGTGDDHDDAEDPGQDRPETTSIRS
jgi:hypothetical protein